MNIDLLKRPVHHMVFNLGIILKQQLMEDDARDEIWTDDLNSGNLIRERDDKKEK